MSVRFVFGIPGSGKTRLCLDEITAAQKKNGGTALIYIVPEQFSLESERLLLESAGEKGLMNACVLSFRRLAYHVFRENGGVSKTILEDTGKAMLLRRTLISLKNELAFYGGAADKQGFIDKLSATISDFHQYGITAEQLKNAAENTSDESLGHKLRDLYGIFSGYKAYLEEHYISLDEILDILAEKIPSSGFLAGAEIWVDGFKSFTPQELKVIEALISKAVRTTFAFTILSGISETFDEHDPCREIKRTVRDITDIAREIPVSIEDAVTLNKPFRYKNAPLIEGIVKGYFDDYASPASVNHSDEIGIYAAGNIYSEIDEAARVITALARDKGLRYRETGIIVSDMEMYKKPLKAVFSRYGIPVFIDEIRDVLPHPMSELCRGALAVVSSGFGYEHVFRVLKTGLLGISRDETDLLENYVLAHGIRGDKWRKQWEYGFASQYENFDKDTMNSLRIRVVEMFSPLTDMIKRGKRYTAEEISRALYSFITESGATRSLSDFADAARQSGDLELSALHTRVYSGIIGVFDKIVEILGTERFTVSEYMKIFEAGLGGVSPGVAPPSADHIFVGDLRRSRLSDIRALIILGVNEGLLPGKPTDGTLLPDEDKAALAAMGLKTPQKGDERAFEEQFLVYQALAKPSEFLFLSYHTSGGEGRAAFPSPVISRLMDLLPGIPVMTAEKQTDTERITVAEPMLDKLLDVLDSYSETGEIPDGYKDVYAFFITNGKYAEKLKKLEQRIVSADKSKNERLSEKLSAGLYGRRLKVSASTLERFVRCPFSYFAQYNLRLCERKMYELESVDAGNVFHSVLNKFTEKLRDENIALGDIEGEALAGLAARCVDETANESGGEILKSSGRYKHFAERLKEISAKSIWALTEHLKKGDFDTLGAELAFSADLNNEPANLELDGGREMELKGRIDRVDTLEIDGNHYVKILDYKSGAKKFSFAEVFYGLQLQLIIYMDAFIRKYKSVLGEEFNGRVLPAAILYFTVTNPIVSFSPGIDSDKAALEAALLKKFKMSGVILSDKDVIKSLDSGVGRSSDIIPVGLKNDGEPSANSTAISFEAFERLMAFAIGKAREIGRDILSGNISVSPANYKNGTACGYCPYKPVCRFDNRTDQFYQRRMKNIKESDALERIINDEGQ